MLLFIQRSVLFVLAIFSLQSCSQDSVKEYFGSHGRNYPVDTSGVSDGECRYMNSGSGELSDEEVQDRIAEGVMYVRTYFEGRDVEKFIAGVDAIEVNKPVLYRDEAGRTGLMVRITGFGAGTPPDKLKSEATWLSAGNRFWQVKEYAYFFRDDDVWQYGGMVE